MRKSEANNIVSEKIRILHVDDDPTFLEISQTILSQINPNFIIDSVSDADKVERMLTEGKYDVIVSDFKMPEKDGLKVIEELRKTDHSTPFIILTGEGNEEVAIRALNLGVTGYFNKFGDPTIVFGKLAQGIYLAVSENRSKQALKEVQERHESIIEQSPSVFELYDISGFQIKVNPAWDRMYNVPRERTIGKYNILHNKQIIDNGWLKFVQRAYAGEIVEDIPEVEYDITIDPETRGLGRKRWISSKMFPIKNKANQINGIVVMHEDVTERKKAQEALAKEKEEKELERKRLEIILDTSPSAVVMIDIKGNFVFANKRAAHLFGFNPLKLNPEENISKIKARKPDGTIYPIPELPITRSLEQGIEVYNEEMLIDNDKGNTFPINISTAPIYDNQGIITSAIAVFEDITERKLVDRQIRESEEKFRKAFEVLPDACCIATLEEGRILEINKAFERIFGFSKKECIGKTSLQIGLYGKGPPERQKLVNRIKIKGQITNLEYIAKRKNGETFPALFSGTIVEKNGEKLIYCVIRDVTVERMNQKALIQSEDKFSKAFKNNVYAATIGRLSDGTIIDANDSAAKIMGYLPNEMIGKSSVELGIVANAKERQDIATELLVKGSIKDREQRMTKKDGSSILVNLSAVLIDINSEPSYLLTFIDVTEQKKAFESLRLERDKLETLTESIGAGLVIIGKDYRVKWINGVLKRKLGDIEGEVCFSALGKSRDPCKNCSAQKIFEEGVQFDSQERKSKDKDGKQYWTQVIATPIFDNEGNVVAATEVNIDITQRKEMEIKLLEFAYRLNNLAPGSCYLFESHELAFKAYGDLTFRGVPGLCIVREDPDILVENYGIKTQEIRLLATKSVKGYEALSNLQSTSMAISSFLKENNSGIVLLDGLEYLISTFGFELVYRLIQERRFDFLETGSILIVPIDTVTLSEKEKALLSSELKIIRNANQAT